MSPEEFLDNSHFVSSDFIDIEGRTLSANTEKVFEFATEYHEMMLIDEEAMTERNTKVVSSFMEHCKTEGIDIPDSMFESYFNA